MREISKAELNLCLKGVIAFSLDQRLAIEVGRFAGTDDNLADRVGQVH